MEKHERSTMPFGELPCMLSNRVESRALERLPKASDIGAFQESNHSDSQDQSQIALANRWLLW